MGDWEENMYIRKVQRGLCGICTYAVDRVHHKPASQPCFPVPASTD